jgi:hypothetical protein
VKNENGLHRCNPFICLARPRAEITLIGLSEFPGPLLNSIKRDVLQQLRDEMQKDFANKIAAEVSRQLALQRKPTPAAQPKK